MDVEQSVLFKIVDGVGVITLNRPQVSNALSQDMIAALLEIFQSLNQHDTLKLLLLEGRGPHFMAGGDVQLFSLLNQSARVRQEQMRPMMNQVHELINLMVHAHVPIIAKVHGTVAGFGMSLIMACDLIIMADHVRLHPAYIHLGLSPDGLFTFHLPRTIGLKKAMYHSLLGEPIDALMAERIGLVSQVVPQQQLDQSVTQVTDVLKKKSSTALRHTKSLLNMSFSSTMKHQSFEELAAFEDCIGTDEFIAGVMSFLKKKKR